MIPRPLISVLVIVVVSAALIATRDVGYLSTKQHPPHVQAVDGHGTLSDYPDWIVALEDSRDAFYREQDALERERIAVEEAERVEAARRAANVPMARTGSSAHSDAWWHAIAVCEQGGRNDPYFGYFSIMDGSVGGQPWDVQVARANGIIAQYGDSAWAASCVAMGYAAAPGG